MINCIEQRGNKNRISIDTVDDAQSYRACTLGFAVYEQMRISDSALTRRLNSQTSRWQTGIEHQAKRRWSAKVGYSRT